MVGSTICCFRLAAEPSKRFESAMCLSHGVMGPNNKSLTSLHAPSVATQRVMGQLAVSRALGDVNFKRGGKHFVTAEPEICDISLELGDEFVIIACDGSLMCAFAI